MAHIISEMTLMLRYRKVVWTKMKSEKISSGSEHDGDGRQTSSSLESDWWKQLGLITVEVHFLLASRCFKLPLR